MRTFILFLILASIAGAQAPCWAILKPTATVSGLHVLLGDIAEVSSTEPATAASARRISLVPTPAPETPLSLTAASVEGLLEGTGVTLRGAPRVTIDSLVLELSPEDQIALASRELERLIAERSETTHGKASFAPSAKPRALPFVPGRHQTKFQVRAATDGPLTGRVPLDVEVVTDGTVTSRSRVTLSVLQDIPVLVARDDLERGQSVVPSLVEERPGTAGLLAPLDLTGLVPKQRIRKGTVLRAELFQRPRVVTRGTTVTVLVTRGALTIRSEGQALADGGVGDIIALRTGERRRVIQGRIVDSRTVQVLEKEPSR